MSHKDIILQKYSFIVKNPLNYFFFILFSCFRCVDIGKFSMLGSNVRTCLHSEWTGLQPVCHGLNQENDYDSKGSFQIIPCLYSQLIQC